MSARRIVAVLLVLSMIAGSRGFGSAAEAPPAPPGSEATPPRVSYINGEVSFWRPGAQDWAPARVNLPLAPGDAFYTGGGGNVEVQIGPRAFVRAAEGTQLGLDNQEPDYVQFRVTAGHAALDLRELGAGQTVELDTPNAVFTIERAGYYRVDVTEDSTTFRTHRGGSATMTPAGGQPTAIAANQQIVLTGADAPRVEAGPAPQLSAWDRWNSQRTAALLQPASARYVPQTVYGAESLDQYGSWRTVDTYGAVWVPSAVAVGWVPYSAGHWIWDPRFGWTWLDDAPWGWAPYHYGRWVFIGSSWGWVPGPIVVRPVYAPALVVFLGGGVTVSVGSPLYWAPLGWGEPIIPWWGRQGHVGVASWQGWGGPRVVNNVVVNRTTTVNVTNINVYNNVHVNNAVVGVSADRFGRGSVQATRIDSAQIRQLKPVRGALEVTPVAASVAPAGSVAARPPATIRERPVVATRPPHDVRPALRAQGLASTAEPVPAPTPKLVPSPKPVTRGATTSEPPSGTRPPDDRTEPKKEKRAATPPPRPTPEATTPPAELKKEKRTVTPPPPRPEEARPEQKAEPRKDKRPTPEVAVPTVPSPAQPAPPAVQSNPGQRRQQEGRPPSAPPSPGAVRAPAEPPAPAQPSDPSARGRGDQRERQDRER